MPTNPHTASRAIEMDDTVTVAGETGQWIVIDVDPIADTITGFRAVGHSRHRNGERQAVAEFATASVSLARKGNAVDDAVAEMFPGLL
jgi:hypothetical protein